MKLFTFVLTLALACLGGSAGGTKQACKLPNCFELSQLGFVPINSEFNYPDDTDCYNGAIYRENLENVKEFMCKCSYQEGFYSMNQQDDGTNHCNDGSDESGRNDGSDVSGTNDGSDVSGTNDGSDHAIVPQCEGTPCTATEMTKAWANMKGSCS